MDTRKLDLNLLVTLEALLIERNVTKAADRLGLSQPAVSAQLGRLRDIFGDQLLVPAQRGMTPTARALALERGLTEALTGIRSVVTHGDTFDPETEVLTMTVAALDAVQYWLLMPLAVDLRARAPHVRLAFRGYDLATLEKQAEAGEIDLVITRPELAPGSFRSRTLLQGRFVFIARKNHPVVRRSVSLEQFLALEHALTEPDRVSFTGQTDRALDALGLKRKVVLSVSSFLVAADAVARSDLVAMVPEGVALDRADRLQILEPPIAVPGFELAMVWHPRIHDHAGHRWVRDALVESVRRGQR